MDDIKKVSKKEKKKNSQKEEKSSQSGETEEENLSDKVLFEWGAIDFSNPSRGANWMLVAGLGFILLLGYSIYTQDWFMIPVLLVTVIGLYFYMGKKPKKRKYKITRMGIYMDDQFYPFDEIHSFWIVHNSEISRLNFVFVKKYLPTLTIPLEKVDPLKLKLFLKKQLPEQEKRGEPFLDKIQRKLKI